MRLYIILIISLIFSLYVGNYIQETNKDLEFRRANLERYTSTHYREVGSKESDILQVVSSSPESQLK